MWLWLARTVGSRTKTASELDFLCPIFSAAYDCRRSTSSLCSRMSVDTKPVVVRVKRKPSQEPLAALWLEINDRPLKRQLLEFSNLSISDATSRDEVRAKKVLVQHVDTISEEASKDELQSLLSNYATPERWQKAIMERKHKLKIVEQKHEHLHSVAIRRHENSARNARFEQIWQKRRSKKDMASELAEVCQLYDIARIDGEDEVLDKAQESGRHTAEDDALLGSYLPLLRECVPTAAAQIEAELNSRHGGYVYDIYTMEEDMGGSKENTFAEFPLVQVDDTEEYYDGPSGSEYDSDDSNADRSELHDYPDEQSSDGSKEVDEKEEDEDDDDFYVQRESESESEFEYEGVMVGDEEEMESLKWRFRPL